jgi:DnaA-like protein
MGIPPNPPARSEILCGGGDCAEAKKTKLGIEQPATEAARLLWEIGAHPTSILELAHSPPEQVGGAIAYAGSEPGITSIAGWVVDALRRHRDEGWPIPRKRTRQEEPLDVEQYIGGAYGDLFRRGSDLADPDAALVPPAIQAPAQAPALDLVPSRAHAPAQGQEGLSPEPTPTSPSSSVSVEGADTQLVEMAGGDVDRTTLVRVWNRVLAAMQVQLSRHEFNTWVRRTELLAIANGVATIKASNIRAKDAIESRYLAAIRDLLTTHTGKPITMCLTLDPHILPDGVGSTVLIVPPPSLLAPSEAPTAPVDDRDNCPSWIGAEQWVILPLMLRVALIGSLVIDGEVQGKSPYLTRLLRTRYAREVSELIAAAS